MSQFCSCAERGQFFSSISHRSHPCPSWVFFFFFFFFFFFAILHEVCSIQQDTWLDFYNGTRFLLDLKTDRSDDLLSSWTWRIVGRLSCLWRRSSDSARAGCWSWPCWRWGPRPAWRRSPGRTASPGYGPTPHCCSCSAERTASINATKGLFTPTRCALACCVVLVALRNAGKFHHRTNRPMQENESFFCLVFLHCPISAVQKQCTLANATI